MLRSQTAARKEILQILVGVKDTPTMAEAKAKLDERYDHFERLVQQARELDPKVSPEIAEQMRREVKELNQALADTRTELNRIEKLTGGNDFIKQFEPPLPPN